MQSSVKRAAAVFINNAFSILYNHVLDIQPEKLDLKWESSDGKSITLSEDSSKDKITASVDDKQITLEQSNDNASVKMVSSFFCSFFESVVV